MMSSDISVSRQKSVDRSAALASCIICMVTFFHYMPGQIFDVPPAFTSFRRLFPPLTSPRG